MVARNSVAGVPLGSCWLPSDVEPGSGDSRRGAAGYHVPVTLARMYRGGEEWGDTRRGHWRAVGLQRGSESGGIMMPKQRMNRSPSTSGLPASIEPQPLGADRRE